MNTALKLSLAAVALVGGTVLVTAAALRPQDKGEGAPPDMDPAMMMKMMELATPGEPHKELAKLVGTWEIDYKMRWGPDMPWMDTKGTGEVKPLLGGRYVMETVQFEVMGMPMEGLHILGYDNMKKEYISLWADSMSTWWVTSRGKESADGTIEYKGTMIDVAGERPYRMVIHPKSDDLHEAEMYDTIPPAGEVKVMTITSKRKK
ncbi:MAG: DUF1579 domain-containing protein [Planctomycetota bacterium]